VPRPLPHLLCKPGCCTNLFLQQGAGKLTFDDFQRALALVAEGRKSSVEEVTAAIVNSGGPTITTNTPSKAH
jgi:hypothetical protein